MRLGKNKTFYLKIAVVFIAFGYFLASAAGYRAWHFFDGIDLVIHEAGHVFFSPFGEFLTVAGGSIFQVLVPLVFVLYFIRRSDIFSGSFVSMWLGQSLVNVAVYAGDAQKMELPLLGNGTHDWNYLLTSLNLLSAAPIFFSLFYLI